MKNRFPSPDRVVARWVTSGLLEAPPAMVKAITDWAMAVRITADLDSAQRGLILEQVKMRSSEDGYKNFQKALSAFRDQVSKAAPPDMFQISLDFAEVLSDIPVREDLPMSYKDIKGTTEETLSGVKHKFLAWAGSAEVWVRRDLDFKRRRLVEHQQKVKDLKAQETPGTEVMSHGDDVRKKFPLDLTGSRYNTPQIRKMLDANGTWDSIEVVLTEVLRAGTGGKWNSVRRVLTTTPGAATTTIISHELQHMVQTMVTSIIPKGEGGLPSRSVRTPQYNQDTNRDYLNLDGRYYDQETPNARQNHDLDDREFYTCLSDLIDDIKIWVDRQHPDEALQKKTILTWMGIVGDDPHNLMQTWKRFAPGKYRKAIKEIYRVFPVLSG